MKKDVDVCAELRIVPLMRGKKPRETKTKNMSTKPEMIRYVLMTANFFAIGESLPEAATKLLKAGAKRSDKAVGSLVLNDPNPTVDNYGGVLYGGSDAPDAMLLHLGKLGKVGDLIA